jgi:hypothetical protein
LTSNKLTYWISPSSKSTYNWGIKCFVM